MDTDESFIHLESVQLPSTLHSLPVEKVNKNSNLCLAPNKQRGFYHRMFSPTETGLPQKKRIAAEICEVID